MRLDTFTRAYLECALWSSTDDNEEPLDGNYTERDISPELLASAIADCAEFQRLAGDGIIEDLSRAGHDFWLTRNHHGAGFWDGEWEKRYGEELTRLARSFGECTLFDGLDGLIYSL